MRSPWPALALASCLSAGQDEPLPVRNERALTVPFLRIAPFFGTLAEHERRLESSWTITNDLKRFPSSGPLMAEEDHETMRLGFVYRLGLPNEAEVAIESAFFSRGGGFLDPYIDWWHKHVLTWSDHTRNSTPFGRSSIVVPGCGTYGSASGLGDTSIRYTKRVSPRYSAAAALKVPTGNTSDLFGSGAFDAGLAVSGLMPIGPRWRLYLQGGVVLQGEPIALQGARTWVHQESASLTFEANSKDTWILQWQSESSALVTGIGASDAPHRVVTFGYRRRISEGKSLELFVTEDRDLAYGQVPEISNVGGDFTAGVRWSMRL